MAAAGAVPVLLPPVAAGAPAAEATVDGLHALIVSGGPDIDPGRYGQSRHPAADAPQPLRDDWEADLVRAARSAALPLLGICRGLQVLNVELGGSLHQHLPDLLDSDRHRPTLGAFLDHPVRTSAGSRIGAIVGASLDVPAHHHQAIDRLAPGLVATAWCDDGIVEAVEWAGDAWVVGVQWHPEVRGGAALFEALTAAAVAYRDE